MDRFEDLHPDERAAAIDSAEAREGCRWEDMDADQRAYYADDAVSRSYRQGQL